MYCLEWQTVEGYSCHLVGTKHSCCEMFGLMSKSTSLLWAKVYDITDNQVVISKGVK
jgi:hypothetical protein